MDFIIFKRSEEEIYARPSPPVSFENVSTLRQMYLDPLLNHIKNTSGRVYPGYNSPVYLMIDIKTDAESTYNVLRRQLSEYLGILSTTSDINTIPKPIRVIVSGNRPIKIIKEDTYQLAGVDGRLSDLELNYNAGFMPIISENYSEILAWNGIGTIPEEDFDLLQSISSSVHQQGKKFRVWAAPENENAWKVLLDAGIDFICTDNLEQAKSYLHENP